MVLGREKVAAIFSDVLICSNCIGMRFALIEAKLGIAKALRVVEIQKCEKTEVSNYDIIVIVLSSFQF